MAKTGRPTKYNDAVVNEICKRIAGGESLNSICKDDHLPTMSCVLLWVVDGKHPLFFDKYRKAREAQGLFDGDRLRDIIQIMIDGGLEPSAAKVAIDALKWTAARNMPRVYGKKVEEADMTVHDEVESDGFDEQMKKATEGAFK